MAPKQVPVQRDERGVAYVTKPDGTRAYLAASPTYDPATKRVVGDPNARQSFFSNQDWNPATGQYDRSTNWHNVIGLGTLAAIGAPAALGAAGVGGAAAVPGSTSIGGGAGFTGSYFGGALPAAASAVPGAVTATAVPGALVTGAAPAIASQGVSAGLGGTGAGMASWLGGPYGSQLIGAGIDVAGNLIGGRQQSKAYADAARIQDEGLRRQQEIEKANELRRREEYDRAEALAKAQWDAEQARFAPYRQLSQGMLEGYARQHNLPLPPAAAPTMAGSPLRVPVDGVASAGQWGPDGRYYDFGMTPPTGGIRRPTPAEEAAGGFWNPHAPTLQADGTYRTPGRTSGGTLYDLAQPTGPPIAGGVPAAVPAYGSADLGSLARRPRRRSV